MFLFWIKIAIQIKSNSNANDNIFEDIKSENICNLKLLILIYVYWVSFSKLEITI